MPKQLIPKPVPQAMRPRASWTPQDRLKFAVRFAEADLTLYSDGDWLKLREDFDCYFKPGYDPEAYPAPPFDPVNFGECIPYLTGDEPADVPRSWFVDLQREVRALLRLIAGEPRARGLSAWSITPLFISLWKAPVGRDEVGWMLMISGAGRDLFIEILFQLLAREPAHQIRLCPRPECGRMFYRVRRQQYCSRRCVNKAYQDSPKGVAIRKARYEKQGWEFGARKAPAKIRRAASTRKGRTT